MAIKSTQSEPKQKVVPIENKTSKITSASAMKPKVPVMRPSAMDKIASEVDHHVVPAVSRIYKIGEKVVYASQGVGIIENLLKKTIGGQVLELYEISIMETGLKVSVPVKMAESQGLRPIVDTKSIERVYDLLKNRDVSVDNQTWNRRYRQYQAKIKTGSLIEIAKVVRDLAVLRNDKDLSFGERDMLKLARGRLVREISIAKSVPEDFVAEELKRICQFGN